MAGNTALARNMRELSVLTCLMIFLYGTFATTSCRAEEHSEIIDAIARSDPVRAERLMLEQLNMIKRSMNFRLPVEQLDLEPVFRR